MAAAKSVLLMLMTASFASAGMAVFLAVYVGGGPMIIISLPGFIIGGFFALKYAMYDKSKAKEEEHKRSRNRHRH